MELHGGQDINISIKLIDDYSVTTNFLGPSKIGIENIKKNIEDEITHYPNQLQEPYKTNLIKWLYKDLEINNNVILGNGASELIDLLIKIFRFDEKYSIYNTKKWRPGSKTVQYVEYGRTCTNYGFTKTTSDDIDSDITCIINPCNPTGEYMKLYEIKKFIENCKDNSLVVVDESMQPWLNENFRKDSLLSESQWIKELYQKRKISLFIIHSWTKFFCCTGIRIGSLICPNEEIKNLLIKYQVPWSCNILALKYLDGCIKDNTYMENTWYLTTQIRANMVDKIKLLFPLWKIYGEKFLSWIWIDTGSESFAKLVYDICKLNGIPIRLGLSGYNLPSFIRIAVRSEDSNKILFNVLESLITFNKINYPHIKIPDNLVLKYEDVEIDKILIHENVILERYNALQNYVDTLETLKVIPAIIVDYNTNILIDGHHRLYLFKKLNMKKIPVIFINYTHPNIIVNPNNDLCRDDVINAALNKKYLEPKSTQHMFIDLNNNIYPIVILSIMIAIN